jgi:hypothetical protein
MNDVRNDEVRTEKTEQTKKAYSRPQLVKHGNVESLTLGGYQWCFSVSD